jgi:hypothetical protein
MQTLKSIGVLSAGKISGLIHASLGLLFTPFFILMALLGTFAQQKDFPFVGVFGVVMAIFMPVFYGVIGFLVGVVGALLYNLFASWVGGVEVELEVKPAYTAPYPIVPASPPIG